MDSTETTKRGQVYFRLQTAEDIAAWNKLVTLMTKQLEMKPQCLQLLRMMMEREIARLESAGVK
jgi:uncharacterized protein YeaC (DUF1315 family)